jgi:hypothetical protein
MKTKLKPSNGNISILGSKTLVPKMKVLGNTLAHKMSKLLKTDVRCIFLDVRTKESQRLCLDICDTVNITDIKEKLEKHFDVFSTEKGERTKPCLRVWGFPLEFIAQDAEKIKSEWRELFDFSHHISRQGNLELNVTADEKSADILQEFRSELENTFTNTETTIRDKQKARVGKQKPGFVIVFPTENLDFEKSGENVDIATVNEKLSAVPTEKEIDCLPVQKILDLCLEHLGEDARLDLIKRFLPQGVGLYDTRNPLILEGDGKVGVRKL